MAIEFYFYYIALCGTDADIPGANLDAKKSHECIYGAYTLLPYKAL